MDMEVTGKRALVTGGTKGIGRAIAEELAREGCHIAICARTASDVERMVEYLCSMGITATGRALDVGDRDTLKAWVKDSATELGGLDIVIPNVSGFGVEPDDAGWQRSFDVDLMGAVHTAEAALPWLEQSDAAAIVLIGSIFALESFADIYPFGYTWPYAAMKAAINNYVGNLSKGLAPKGIRVNMVSPGPVYFPGGRWAKNKERYPEIYQKMKNHCSIGRFGKPEEVAKPVVFLASPAASYITGSNLIIDGATTNRVDY